MNRSIGEALSELRKAQGFSRGDLAKRAKLSVRTIEQIEEDDDNVSLGSVKRAAFVLDCWPALMPIPGDRGCETIDQADERYRRRHDKSFLENRSITLDDVPYLFPEEDDESAYRLVLGRAAKVFESLEMAESWMTSEVPALCGEKPTDLLRQAGEDGKLRILEVLDKIETGDFS